MDLAYDHIQDDAYTKDRDESSAGREGEPKQEQPQPTLNQELQDAYKTFSASPWGTRIGGFFGNVVKQVRATSVPCPFCIPI